MNIFVTGPVGYETASRLYEENKESLAKRFAGFFLKQFEKLENEKVLKEEIPDLSGRVFEISEGGLFGSLWKAMEIAGAGCEVFLSDIPVHQEVVEIMELFDENPYETSSDGAWLVLSELEPYELGNEFTCIGHTTNKKDRVVILGEQKRFLTPLKRQMKDIADRQHDRQN